VFYVQAVYIGEWDHWAWLHSTIVLLGSVLGVGCCLNSVPDVILELRQKPNGIAYKPLCDKILAEHERRQGSPPFTSLWVNNGVDPFIQACVVGITALATVMFANGWVLAFMMLVDLVLGCHALKAMIKYYVEHPAPQPMPTVIDRLRKANAETT
jgi:hypothetical protein